SLLTRCFWEPGVGSELWFEPWAKSDSALSLALALPRAFLARLRSLRAVQTRHLEIAAADDRELIAQSSAILADPNVHFVYIHLPVPHPPGIFNRQTGALCACGNYLDNLAFADTLLGRLRAEIDATAADTPTTLIISSDHSWRVPIWKASPGWTSEEEQISQGRFDPRPVFLVHFAGQTAAGDVRAPVPELVEHDVIEGLLTGNIRGPQDVEALGKTRAVSGLQGKRLRAAAFP
ncbi:MAG: sulfatase-like hydrolase/transferase, partial [Acidobacteriaceae bacterium]